MSAVIFTVGLVVWLVAAYAFVRVALSLLAVIRAAPAGQGAKAFAEMMSLNFPAVRQRVGEASDVHVSRFRKSFGLFAGCTAGLVGLVLLNIATGNAA